jgi:hypothetical protein
MYILMTDQYLVHSYADLIKRHILEHMKTDNLTDLIELLQELGDVEPDPELDDGQVRGPDGEIINL